MSISDATGTEQFLTFKLGEETFAVEVAKAREILDPARAVAGAGEEKPWTRQW